MTSPTSCLPCILGAFQALRIPSPGFLSSFLLSLPSFTLSFLPSAAVEPVVLRRCVWKKKKKTKNADFRLVPESRQVWAWGFRDSAPWWLFLPLSPHPHTPFLLKPESFITSYITLPLSVTKATKPPSRCDLNGLTFPQLVSSAPGFQGI